MIQDSSAFKVVLMGIRLKEPQMKLIWTYEYLALLNCFITSTTKWFCKIELLFIIIDVILNLHKDYYITYVHKDY